MKYRPELDGIRAVALLGVLVYHVVPSRLPGGFLGVDVFFVLSGFLITTILLGYLKRRESLKQFWLKRARRILPALVGMVAFTLIVGSALLLRVDRSLLVEHAVAALLSVSNFFIWDKTSGYWAVDASTLPLLHTWSLSVEEQFYLVFPVLLMASYRWRKKYLAVILSVLAVLSFFGARLIFLDPSAAFLFSPFRMWEILLGRF
jgi:peptidoglycan/LPS O-acetylase OafA/YrhL